MGSQRTPGPLFAKLESQLPGHDSDDLESHLHRQVIGGLGLVMPILLRVLAGLRPTADLTPGKLLDSVSAYYYTGAVAAFVGILCVLAVFLLTYRGYESSRQDRVAALIAGVAALLVAFFPTEAPLVALKLGWWTNLVGEIHGWSAAVLFLSFVYFSLVLFPKSKATSWKAMTPDKRKRNVVYYVCGAAMLVFVAWAGVATRMDRPIFWPETLALWCFAVSWLAKGRADLAAALAARKAAQGARNVGSKFINMLTTLRR